jgi:hypothetical protein
MKKDTLEEDEACCLRKLQIRKAKKTPKDNLARNFECLNMMKAPLTLSLASLSAPAWMSRSMALSQLLRAAPASAVSPSCTCNGGNEGDQLLLSNDDEKNPICMWFTIH